MNPFFFLLSLISIAQAKCPLWVCKDMNQTICTQLHGFQVFANIKHCPTDYFCKLSDFKVWSALESPSSTKSFNCTRQNYDAYDISSLKGQYYFCGFRDLDDELAVGEHPKICDSDQDCLTVGGWTTACVCGFDGKSYCSADFGSSAFDEYWTKCEQEGGSNNPIITAVERAYWEYYHDYYVYIISAPDCVKNLLWEFDILNDLDSYRSGSDFIVALLGVYVAAVW